MELPVTLLALACAPLIALAAILTRWLFPWLNQERQHSAAIATELEAMRHREQRLSTLVERTADVILTVNRDGVIEYQSGAAAYVWEYPADTLTGTMVADLVHPDDIAGIRQFLSQAIRTPTASLTSEFRIRRADDSWSEQELIATNLLSNRYVAGIVLTCRDVTERKAFERELTHQAFHDPLTSLANRALFLDRVGHGLARGIRAKSQVVILYLDLDNFKVVNDSLGHHAGDAMLTSFSERLLACARAEDTVARLGGDEFAILLGSGLGIDAARQVAERIASALRVPFQIDEHTVYSSASIGIAVAEPDAMEAERLMRHADLAMYHAKSNGKACYSICDSSIENEALERLTVEMDLREALERGQLRIHYQPIVSLETGRPVEVEALVRWEHPTRGLISPNDFIPIAEETGLIISIGRWILETACQEVRTWQMQVPTEPPIQLAVNVSARQLWAAGFADEVAAILDKTEIDPKTLTLELTETMLFNKADMTISTLDRIKALGVHLAIDDFGTGHSSLSYVKRFPVDAIKIDRSFTDGLGRDAESSAIVRSVVELARNLGLSVTAEGIETRDQLDELRWLGCDRGQGFYFAQPLTVEQAEKLVAAGREPALAVSARAKGASHQTAPDRRSTAKGPRSQQSAVRPMIQIAAR